MIMTRKSSELSERSSELNEFRQAIYSSFLSPANFLSLPALEKSPNRPYT